MRSDDTALDGESDSESDDPFTSLFHHHSGQSAPAARAWWDQALIDLLRRTPPSSPLTDTGRIFVEADSRFLSQAGEDIACVDYEHAVHVDDAAEASRPWWDQALLQHCSMDRPLRTDLDSLGCWSSNEEPIGDVDLPTVDSGNEDGPGKLIWVPSSGLMTPPPSPPRPGQQHGRDWANSPICIEPHSVAVPGLPSPRSLELPLLPLAHDTRAPQAIPHRRFFRYVSTEGGLLNSVSAICDALGQGDEWAGASVSINPMKRGVRIKDAEERQQDLVNGGEFQGLLALVTGRKVPLLAHAVFTTNLASPIQTIRLASRESLLEEACQAQAYGIELLVFHLGSFSTKTERYRARRLHLRLARDIRSILDAVPELTLAIETMTHRCQNETSASFEDIRQILRRVNRPDRLGVCIDLCHVHATQLDLSSPTGRAELCAAIERLGARNVKAFHVNDCGAPHGSGKDVHMGVGNGLIGLDGLRALLRDPRVPDVPFVLETPRYFRHNRPRGPESTLTRQTERLEAALQDAELGVLRVAVEMDDTAWDRGSGEVVRLYKRERRELQGRIGRLWAAQADRKAYWRFVDDRRRAALLARKVMTLKRVQARQQPGMRGGEGVYAVSRSCSVA